MTHALLTVLQLDTAFPRIAGDVAASATYRSRCTYPYSQGIGGKGCCRKSNSLDITAFEDAIATIGSGMITTSCGFLGYWQDHLA